VHLANVAAIDRDALVADSRRIAESREGSPAGSCFVGAEPPQLVGAHVEVKRKLIVDLALENAAADTRQSEETAPTGR
jgi:hypothetical protein